MEEKKAGTVGSGENEMRNRDDLSGREKGREKKKEKSVDEAQPRW